MASPAVLYQAGNHAGRPSSGSGCVLYSCTDHDLVYRDDGTSWTTFMTLVGGSGGDIATDTIWDAAGDTVHGTGANTAARLAAGAGGTYYRMNAGATAPEWVSPIVSAFAKETSGQTFTTGLVDLAGATISATPSVVETWVCTAELDIEWSVASAGNLALGTYAISGTATAAAVSFAVLQGNTAHRATVVALARWTGVSAAAHTVKLQIQKTGAGGTAATAGGSSISLLRIPE